MHLALSRCAGFMLATALAAASSYAAPMKAPADPVPGFEILPSAHSAAFDSRSDEPVPSYLAPAATSVVPPASDFDARLSGRPENSSPASASPPLVAPYLGADLKAPTPVRIAPPGARSALLSSSDAKIIGRSFSIEPVVTPEPGSLGLIAIAAAWALRRPRRIHE